MRAPAEIPQSRVLTIIESAARRRRLVLAVEHSAVALCAVLSGLILVLLAGTQVLDGRWLFLLLAVGIAIAFLRLRKHAITRYRLAQLVDRKLELADSLSTAWFLLERPERRSESTAQIQIERTETKLRTVDPRIVFPFVWRRIWVLAAALGALAFGLFALRYLVTSSLSLKPALLPISFTSPIEAVEKVEKLIARQLGAKRDPFALNRQLQVQGNGVPGADDAAKHQEPHAEAAGNATTGDAAEKGGKPGEPQSNSNSENQSGKLSNSRDLQNGSAKSQDASAEKGPRAGQTGQKENGGNQGSPSLAERMKDAFSGLMEKMRPQESAGKSAESSPSGDGKQAKAESEKNAQNSQSDKSMGNPQKGERQGQSGKSQSQAEATEKSPGSQSEASNESADKRGSDAHSGIGRQDGQKTLRDADQLHAMGKLEEIIGKRSASLTGDMTVETSSSHQPLHTQYSGRVSQHQDLGGEIDRNDVPLNLQTYVREYMEQVRKQADKQR